MGGCIPMLIQLADPDRHVPFLPGARSSCASSSFLWADDLSSYDSIVNLPFSIPFYGDHVSLFALLMAVSAFRLLLLSATSRPLRRSPQMAGMKFMMVYTDADHDAVAGSTAIRAAYATITCCQTSSRSGRRFVIRRIVDDEKIHAVMQANAARKSKGKKSKFQQRYEELMRQQEAQQRANSQVVPGPEAFGKRPDPTGIDRERSEPARSVRAVVWTARAGRRRNL